ncbi:hypothetical protein BR63_07105 [Thermanaerosceptrum fracticalcis]|uniref:Uncharacterized protein n=1 Tax=Thermanaerosceptrum fracticalcis TaxID=1712410 RepID=A0A7G6E1Z6_THEFR|nr:hypothetical protein [Thermanaerosceptrum fracticalcis]QNB46100.1 hypothetical protein BR63_07105 [Thermanaerosceptrum fracticalcis]
MVVRKVIKANLICQEFKIPLLCVLPLQSSLSTLGDEGRIEEFNSEEFLKTDLLLVQF